MHTRLEVEHFSCNSSQVAKLGRLETNSVQRTPPQSTSSMPFTSHSKVIFCCDLCGQPFTAKSNLLRHQILKHGRQKMKRGRPPNNGY